MTLLDQVADFQNLLTAYKGRSRAKRQTHGYQKFFFNPGETLVEIRELLLSRQYR
jgi:hypothetical protein